MYAGKISSTVIAILFVTVFALCAAEASNGQGRYTKRYSKQDVSNIITKVETSSDEFRRDFTRAMNDSKLNGTAEEDRSNNIVRDFERSVDRLRREFDRRDTWWESRADVQNMIRDARPVNTMMTKLPFRRILERQWKRLQKDINAVAETFDLPGLNGGGWNGK